MLTINIQIIVYTFLCNIFLFSHAMPIKLTDNYLPPDDPNITNLMVSHSDCENQHNLRQFNLKPCTEASSNIQHAKVRARVVVPAKTKRVKTFKRETYAEKERKICFQGSVKNRRVDSTVWNHNTLHRPITLDPLECKNFIRHLNGTNNEIFNNFIYNRTFTISEHHYFQEKLEQYQTHFTVYNFNKMYTGTFTYMTADKLWLFDPKNNLFHNCPAHNQFEVNLLSGRLSVSEVELTFDDTENLMVIYRHAVPYYFVDGSVNSLLKLLSHLFGFMTIFV